MKIKTLSVLVGVGTPLILNAGASAGFLGIKVLTKENQFGLLVCNVYAEFDRPGEDLFSAAAGTANAPMLIQVIGGGSFYNHAFGNDRPPLTALVAAFPSLAFDSFVTMGVKQVGVNGQPADNMTITPSFPGVSGSALSTNNSGWAITPNLPAADPFNPDFVAGDGNVLIGQFSTADGTGISGTIPVHFTGGAQSVVSFFHVPGPGALWLLGAAGLLGRRRRRRPGCTVGILEALRHSHNSPTCCRRVVT